MTDLQELEIIAQLVDSMEIALDSLEKSYSEKDAEKFNKLKEEILKFQSKINEILNNKLLTIDTEKK